ncbi:Proline-rich receptor protein kinase PERK3 [Spatholobus suberectus]|nr:Proline-rich receptor protein kinase PERK3 [Spatholobus suberectus]
MTFIRLDLVGLNQRIIEKELGKKKKEYLDNEELAQIAILYESNKVTFKIKLFTGSSLKDVAIKGAINLKADWVILDRKMKKDEEFFLQQLSCGISIIRGNNRIATLRAPLDLPVEIQCNSHETYDESLPSIPYEDLFGIDVFPKSKFKDDEQKQIQCQPSEEEGCSNITTNTNEKTCQTSPYHLSTDETVIYSNQMIDKIEKDEQCQDQEQMQSMTHETEGDTTFVIKNDQTTAREIADQLCQDEGKTNNFHGEKWELRNPTKRKEMTDQPKDDLLNQNQAQTLSISNGVILHGEQEKSILENSMCTFCSVCKTRRPTIGWQKEFTYEELQAATDAFSLKNCLSQTGHLFTFRGQLEGGLKLVVKQHDITNTQVREKMKSEIQTILKARHKNVIMLLGSSTSEHFLLTVYEYACNGSLDKFLSKLITGRRTTDIMSEDKSLVEWAKPLLKGKNYSQLVDPIIRNSYEEDHLRWLVQVTTQCLKKNPKERYSMNMVVSALQDIADSELCHMTEDITPAISDSRIVLDINGSQGPTTTKADQPSQEEEQIESRFDGEEKKLRLTVENNHFYMIGRRNSDKLSQIEEQMQSRPQGEERSSGKMIINDHTMDQTVVDQMSEFEEQMPSTLYREGITTQKNSFKHMIGHTKGDKLSQDQEEGISFVEMKIGLIPAPISGMIDQTKADPPVQDKTQTKRSSHENLLDGRQGETILENTKSSACSICKSRRPNIACPKDFTYDVILEATEGFSIENSLSESEDGPTFKGLLERQVKIVVKKYQITTSHEEKILKSEVQSFISARHKNVVMLLGLCTNKSKLMIVYERVCNGSLDQYLTRGSFQSLTWKQRLKVAMGTARGLQYLHGNNIIHGNIKPSNILLTHDFEPLIGDFSFRKVKLEPKKSSKDKSVRNSGYTAPEYLENGKLSNKTDVYSFGVVLLELITGRRANDKLPGGKSLVGWARPLLGGKKKYAPLVDLKISNSYEEEKLQWLIQVTEQCLRKNPKGRATMNMVVSALQGIEESAECCVIEDSSPEKSYLPHDDLAKIRTQGQIKDDLVSQDQERIDRTQYEEEKSLRLTVKTNHMISQRNADQLRQGGEDVQRSPREEMSGVTVISNDMIDQINPDQQIQEKQHMKGSFHIEEMGQKEVDMQQKVSKDKKQMQGSCDEDLLNGNEAKTILETSKSSVCSICKSRRPNSALQKKYTYEELQAATEGFSIKYSLREGEYRPAFRGQLENNQEIVIKQHTFTNLQEQEVFMSEFQLLLNVKHENVIMLLGSCRRKSQLLTVYEQACNGSLDQYLSRGSCRSLTWGERVKVAIGVARGLKYLHENNIIHGRIKPSNILLNHEFKPLARPLIGERKYRELVDPKVSSSYDEQELVSLVHVTKNCLKKNSKERFTMNMVVSALPYVVDSNDIYVKEDFSPEKPNFSDVTNSKVKEESLEEEDLGIENTEEERRHHREGEKEESLEEEDLDTENSEKVRRNHREGEEESLEEEDLGTENSEEREDNITCSTGNNETEITQECDSYPTCGESSKETEEKESSSTKVCQKWEGCLTYGGAREFYLEGAQEYAVCEEFFGWCGSI